MYMFADSGKRRRDDGFISFRLAPCEKATVSLKETQNNDEVAYLV